jgi:hypothetical protein
MGPESRRIPIERVAVWEALTRIVGVQDSLPEAAPPTNGGSPKLSYAG